MHPTGFATRYEYSDRGFKYKVVNASINTSLWETKNDEAFGYLTEFDFGNGANTQKTFEPALGLIDSIRVVKNTNVVQDHQYQFDAEGNLRSREDKKAAITQHFCYDSLYRLTDALLNTGCNDITGSSYAGT